MQINYEGEEYTLDFDNITNQQAKVIKRATGLTLGAIEDSLGVADPDALGVIFWLMLVSSGKKVDLESVDFKIVKFSKALEEASLREAEANEKAAEDAEAEKRLEEKAAAAKAKAASKAG